MARILLIEKNDKWQGIAKNALEPAHHYYSASPAKALSSQLRQKKLRYHTLLALRGPGNGQPEPVGRNQTFQPLYPGYRHQRKHRGEVHC